MGKRMVTTTASGSMERQQSVPMRRLPEHLIALGQPVVSLDRITELVGLSRRSVHTGLARLRADRRLFSPARGLYVAVPPEYRSWGVVPAEWFVDPMMELLDRRYYVGLLTAAAVHGVAPQAPQVFQVMVDRQLADRDLGRVRLRFHVSRLLADGINLPVEQRTVHTGSLTVATPDLTAIDVVAHPGLSGGLHNVADVVAELDLDPARVAEVAAHHPRVVARRLGWLLERIGGRIDLEPLREVADVAAGELLPLDVHGPRTGTPDRGWGLIVNADIDGDR